MVADLRTILSPFAGLLRCTICGREQPVPEGREWPKCCGYEMTFRNRRDRKKS